MLQYRTTALAQHTLAQTVSERLAALDRCESLPRRVLCGPTWETRSPINAPTNQPGSETDRT